LGKADLFAGLTQSWGETRFLEVTLRLIANSCTETRFLYVSPILFTLLDFPTRNRDLESSPITVFAEFDRPIARYLGEHDQNIRLT
jgi:hypothetical protein